MSELELTLDVRGWLRLAAGLPLLLGPGVALVDRWLPRERARWILAPVASLSLLTLSAFALEFILGIPPVATTFVVLSIALTTIIAWPRIRQAPTAWRRCVKHGIRWPHLGNKWWLPVIFAFVALAQTLPHIPGPGPDGAWDTYPTLVDRAAMALEGDDSPYPIHVDEHIHFAFAMKMIRDETIEINDVYTDEEPGRELFSISGFRQERGFTLSIVIIHDLLGVPLALLFRFLPAVWSGCLAMVVWYLARPAPGAFVAAAMVAILPSTARFLGPGFLISSPFALVWVFATLLVTLRGRGPSRFFAIMLLVTAAYFQHLVIGTLSIAAALLGMVFTPKQLVPDRVAIVVASLLPMLWIVPGIWFDVQQAVTLEHALPFAQNIFRHPGAALYVLAASGAAWTFLRPRTENAPHRVLAVLAILLAASMAWSIQNDHSNDATYSRLLFALFLGLGILASWTIGRTAQEIGKRFQRRRWQVVTALAVTLVTLNPAIANNLDEPMYRIHNEASWNAAKAFEASGAGPGDRFLSHPWRAPIFSAVTGAEPHTVLYPGSTPANGADWDFYVRTGGADADWLAQRQIRYIVHGPPPNAPHAVIGPGTFQIVDGQ